ncbi:hypothetical protein [Chroococcidiopsis sp. CCMEE 29]|jgi:hypothetical protein|uniref:hypothetical protein n=1 Tax=Chroococcidiopsis sp. CCMEE 29 TaxID=155894 RepID=UPI002020AE0B|nr:hypothetical protein [Chroococcidiopsis sp. CCMEE 29]
MSEIENQMLQLHNRMFMSPQDFSYRWGIGYEALAEICCVSKSTTYHWLGGKASRRRTGEAYQRILAVADFLMTNAEQVHPLLERWHQRK